MFRRYIFFDPLIDDFMRNRTLITAFLFIILTIPAVFAQTVPGLDRSNYSPAAYYRYSEPGQVTILVNVWGTVRNPGLYEVPRGTHLSTLFSLAGGPAINALNRREHRTVTTRLNRSAGGQPQVVFEAVMEDEIFASPEDPELQAGDVLLVETFVKQAPSWRDFLPIISAAASIGVVIAYFTR